VISALSNPWVDRRINRQFNPCSDDEAPRPVDHRGMTTTDYLINAAFVFVVLRQAGERRLDRRSLVVPLAAVYLVAQLYVHSIPTAGNEVTARLATVQLRRRRLRARDRRSRAQAVRYAYVSTE
jgi:hypothetical protein